jgi:hypothetical protein
MSIFIEKSTPNQISQSVASQSLSPDYAAIGFDTIEGGAIFITNNVGDVVDYEGDTVSSSYAIDVAYCVATESFSASRFTSASYSVSSSYAFTSATASFITSSVVNYNKVDWAYEVSQSVSSSYSSTITISSSVAVASLSNPIFTSSFTGSRNNNILLPQSGSSSGYGYVVVKGNTVYMNGYSGYIFGSTLGDVYPYRMVEMPYDESVTEKPVRIIKYWYNKWNIIVLGEMSTGETRLFVAGQNDYGQLGNGTTTDRNTLAEPSWTSVTWTLGYNPAQDNLYVKDFAAPNANNDEIKDLPIIARVDIGKFYKVSSLNTPYVAMQEVGWGGRNDRGTVGNGTITQVNLPVVTEYNGNSIVNGYDTLLSMAVGNQYYGSSFFAYINDDNNDSHMVKSFGDNTNGQLSLGNYFTTSSTYTTTPTDVYSDNYYGPFGGGSANAYWKMSEVQTARRYNGSSNYYHSVFKGRWFFNSTSYLTASNQLYAAGDNSFSQLGDGTTTRRDGFVAVRTGPYNTSTAASIALSPSALYNITKYTCVPIGLVALDSTGSLWATGYNDYGYFGDGSTSNAVASTYAKIIQTGVSNYFVHFGLGGRLTMITVTTDNKNWISGANTSGQCGTSTNIGGAITTREEIKFPCGGYVTEMCRLGDYRFSDNSDFIGTMVKTNTGRVYVTGHRIATATPRTENAYDYFWQELNFPD